ncbi:MAG TPA: TonB-dependent receptor [Bacteroidales bacterium]|nr:MAG: TonB dependent receptor [Bacteroidetes bacterium ADurb.Bin145]HOU01993.1 TonB-dependent receptor [Bacteroidales bacterium]HQK67722.1 TonB-dependent receptor [Bacteroidales bacterium]
MKKINYLLRTDLRSRPEKPKRNSKFWILFTLIALFGFFQVNAQYSPVSDASLLAVVSNADGHNDVSAVVDQRRVTGTIKNELGDPLIGATVQVKGTTLGTLTDIDGKFSVDVPNESAVLVVSFIGYVAQEIPVAGRSTVELSLVPTVESLEEVVVVGYGTQKRTTMTGSVSVVKGDEVAKVPVSNITNAMAGKLAGVLTSQSSGQPGEDAARIYVRGVATTGSSNPLIVVDGVIRDALEQIDPAIIESVTVLKDASSVAPYGIAGANGVILVTTKKGNEGLPTLTFNTYYGIQSPTYYPDLLNAVDYMKIRNEALLNADPTLTVDKLAFNPDVIANYAKLHAEDPDRYPDSRSKDLVHFNIPVQKHDLQISGGTNTLRYFTSLGYFGQEGLFDRVNYNRFNYNLSVDAKVTKTTTVALSLLGTKEKTNDLDVASSSSQIFRSGYKFIPTEAIYFSNGLWGQFAGNSPVAVLNGDGYETTDRYTLLSTVSVEQQIPWIKGLSVKGAFSYDMNNSFRKGWHTPFYYYTIDLNANPRTFTKAISTQEGGAAAYTYLEQQVQRNQRYNYQAFINYSRRFGQHDIVGLIVAEARNNDYANLTARRNNFAIGIDELSLGSSDKNDYDNGGSSSVGAQLGYVYRLGWTFKNRYMAEATGRYDGHYYFAPGKRWAYFPAFSVGWRISEEDFMKGLTWLNNLKLRASWGKSGNLAGSAYQYLSGYTLSGNRYAFGTGKMVQGAYVSRENNPNITWEVSQKSDVGFEAGLWNSLLTVEFDLFFEKRSGMLLSPSITVPYEYGLSLAQENAGKMNNFGFEVQVGSRKQFQNGLNVNVAANLSLAKNKMIETFETAATYNNPNRRRTGRPYGTVFGYRALGFFSTAEDLNNDNVINTDPTKGPVEWGATQWGTLRPGDIKYEDISGPDGVPDGKIDSNDEQVIGYPDYPMMTYGLNGSANWKGFDLSLFFQGSALRSTSIQNFQTFPFFNNNSNLDYEYYNNRWTRDNQNSKYPIAWAAPSSNMQQGSSFWQRHMAYLRLKNVQFGYTLPKTVMNKLKMQSIRVYVAGQNVLTFQNLKFLDPETTNQVGYPAMKIFNIGANVTF